MEEWIKKSDAIKAIIEYADTHTFNSYNKGMHKAVSIIASIPSADRPRGELKYMGTYYKCSVCGSEFMDEITFMGELNYCPACGADMKGADDE